MFPQFSSARTGNRPGDHGAATARPDESTLKHWNLAPEVGECSSQDRGGVRTTAYIPVTQDQRALPPTRPREPDLRGTPA